MQARPLASCLATIKVVHSPQPPTPNLLNRELFDPSVASAVAGAFIVVVVVVVVGVVFVVIVIVVHVLTTLLNLRHAICAATVEAVIELTERTRHRVFATADFVLNANSRVNLMAHLP